MSLRYAVLIPARYQSSRFPGKPLAEINGKTMIQHVWEKCVSAVGEDLVYIATDDQRIVNEVKSFGGKALMTSSECLTGTDRLAEANITLNFDFIINVQGDEPMIDPNDIIKIRDIFLEDPTRVVNAYTQISEHEDPYSNTLPKVVVSKSSDLLYMSRAAIPISKSGELQICFKQVCIYAFSKSHLNFFATNPEKTPLESIEDIEILRFLENDIKIKMVEVGNFGIAVDTVEDLEKVKLLLNSTEKN
ncbi:3-deoxy-manno-octulosonate cytidylyltransferase [Pseudoalteromonas sp. SCSIO_11900]|uniref:3-deoxy-manno-octulosonate cytidylyltransferase n=1 Tax=Pseudoalteromonas sp. SCSIO_11900 TaxID=1461766 RepID=UPI0004482D49|nr:3-deoxy-manno-octulosonate cytidylyltransferase [Pseudoalteromonas sp. SCSIO_11900]EWS98584.1 3-deoxy-manno-octulosonate cytidylyltransferase [Pseudoalteromonas sp. SCSIO_11900]